MGTLVEKLPKCLRLSGFPDLSGKVLWITFKFSLLDFSTMFCKSYVNKSLIFFFFFFLVYRGIITAKTVALYKKLYFFIKGLKSKKKKLALTLFYYVSREIWLGNSKFLICRDQSRFNIFSRLLEFEASGYPSGF